MRTLAAAALLIASTASAQTRYQFQYGQTDVNVMTPPVFSDAPSDATLKKMAAEKEAAETQRAIIWAGAMVASAGLIAGAILIRGRSNGNSIRDIRGPEQVDQQTRPSDSLGG